MHSDRNSHRPWRAYIGSFTSEGGAGVTVADLDMSTGALATAGSVGSPTDPSYLAVAPDRGTLYAVSETGHGAAAAFALDETGPPRLLGTPRLLGGAGPTHLAVAAGHLVTAQYTDGTVATLRIGADGGLQGRARVLRHEGSGPDPDRQRGPHAHQVVPAPQGPWVLGVDLGADVVRTLALDPASGELRVHGETGMRPGSGPRQLAFHPSGEYFYVLGELDPALTVCRWNAREGRAEVLAEVAVAGHGFPGHDPDRPPRAYPSAVVVDPGGRFLWVAVRGTDEIAVLDLADGPDLPRLRSTVDSGGSWPRDLELDPTGRWLYAAHERSGEVSWFDLDLTTGVPRLAGSVPVAAATCVVFG
ncbi:lactonase family protein [Streptomyces sp. NPDC006879]|uniref:lactonase family protein n=1 Tax=Streptomyces sp. NPDC006879 TaxID=3364767 RepID=UPI00367F56B8